MRLSSHLAPACFVALAAAFVPLEAQARELDYRAPGGCPSRSDVEARLAPDGRDARIDVRSVKNGFRGDVVLGEGDRRLARSVEAKSCGAVIEALALVVSLDRDRDRDEEEQVPAPQPSSPAPIAAPETRDAAPATSTSPRSPSTPIEITVGLALFGTSFARGEVLQGGSPFVGIASTDGLGGQSWLQPSARLSFVRTLPNVTFRSDVSPEFTLTSGQLDLCPLGIGLETSVAFTTCARGEIGSLEAQAAGNEASNTGRLWMTAGGIARARILVASGKVRPMLEASAGLVAPLLRDRFHFTTHEPIVAPPWLWTLSVGGGVVFP